MNERRKTMNHGRRTTLGRTAPRGPRRLSRTVRRRLRAAASRRRRRGVLLLVVLSMLVLFLMLGTAFVVSSKQDQRALKATSIASRAQVAAVAEGKLLDEALAQVVRDTRNVHSVLRGHSLLQDMYGNDALHGTLQAVYWAGSFANRGTPYSTNATQANNNFFRTGGQLVDLALNVVNNVPQAFSQYNQTVPVPTSHLDDAYAGQILTFLNGPAGGVSTRIVKYAPAVYDNSGVIVTPPIFTVMDFKLADGTPLRDAELNSLQRTLSSALAPSSGLPLRMLVNGKPFNGTGVGYASLADPTLPRSVAGQLVPGVQLSMGGSYTQVNPPLALLPNAVPFDALPLVVVTAPVDNNGAPVPAQPIPYFAAGGIDLAGLGGADESYDAPDFQNMLLAAMDLNTRPNNPTGRLVESAWENPDNPLPAMSTSPPLPNNAPLVNMVLPSLHRPDLLHYWALQAPFTPTPPIGNPPPTDVFNSRLADLSLPAAPALLRRVMLRPNWFDHPEFTGSNPEYEAALQAGASGSYGAALSRMVYGPWDVDNDRDGVRDSVWVDFGAPVIQALDGKRYKPLAAILCVDLDGRVNVNAVGSLEIAERANNNPNYSNTVSKVAPATLTIKQADANPAETTMFYPRGLGLGPAEISLAPVLGPNSFRSVLIGQNLGATYLPGRYGQDPVPGSPGAFFPVPGYVESAPQQLDPLAQVTMQEWPGRNPNSPIQFGAYGQLPDHSGRYTVGVNRFGQGVFDALEATNIAAQLTVGSPYEANLAYEVVGGSFPTPNTSGIPADMPYSVFELERVLRLFDADASTLPNRLAHLSGVQEINGNTDLPARNLITSESADVPVPSVTMPTHLAQLVATQLEANNANPNGSGTFSAHPPRSVADLIEMRVRMAMVNADWPNPVLARPLANQTPVGGPVQINPNLKWPLPLTWDATMTQNDFNRVRLVMKQLTAPEVLAGGRLNLNRPLGNGIDDNGNGVIDEPLEEDANSNGQWEPSNGEGQVLWQGVTAAVAAASYRGGVVAGPAAVIFPQGLDFYLNNNGTPNDVNDDFLGVATADPRQMLARHLYVLALTAAARPDYLQPTSPKDIEADRELARRLAQWAINVVDFRDADNIMTPFEYDVNPFDGWSVDGDARSINDIAGKDGKVRGEQVKPNGSLATPSDDIGGIVWGAEQPELVVTETLGWHDRRTDDGATENPYPSSDKKNPMMGISQDRQPDTDFDQVLRPKGAALIELYNPTGANPAASADTHALNTNGPNGSIVDLGIDLAKISAALNGVPGSPVWRITVHRRHPPQRFGTTEVETGTAWDPDDARALPYGLSVLPKGFADGKLTNDAYTLADLSMRTVYFTGRDPERDRINAGQLWDRDGVAFFNDVGRNPILPVRPGRYMVVGSGVPVDAAGIPVPFQPVKDNAGITVSEQPTQNTGYYMLSFGDRKNRNIPGPHRGIMLHTAGTNRVRTVDATLNAYLDSARNFRVESPDASVASGAPQMLMSAGLGNQPVSYDPQSESITDVAIIDQVDDVIDNITYYNERIAALGRQNSPLVNDFQKRRQRYRRFTFSEPAHGYAWQFNGSIWDPVKQQYVASAGRGKIDEQNYRVAAIDIPLDGPIGGQLGIAANADPAQQQQQQPVTPPEYLLDPTKRDGTTLNMDPVLFATGAARKGRREDPGASYSFIYLQRLANPLLPWNPSPGEPAHNPNIPVNPYLTLDSSSVNLSVYNSRGSQSSGSTNQEEDGNSANSVLNFFSSHERGYTYGILMGANNTAPMASFAGRESPSLERDRPPRLNLLARRVPENQYNAKTMGDNLQSDFSVNRFPYNSIGFLNSTYQDGNLTGEQRKVLPRQPFEWLAWNNRPYTGSHELALVPAVSSSQVLRQYTNRLPRFDARGQSQNPQSLYDTSPGAVTGNQPVLLPFAHLANLFFDRDDAVANNATTTPNPASESGLFRILDYIDSPSRFVGNETRLNPSVFGARPTDAGMLLNQTGGMLSATDPESAGIAPYNAMPTFREPGMVNINTLASRRTYGALFQGDGDKVLPEGNAVTSADGQVHSGPKWGDFITSRRGYNGGNQPFEFDNTSPTFYLNPFRVGDAADLVPLPNMRRQRHVDVTMLRGIIPPQGQQKDAVPLFSAGPITSNTTNVTEGRDTYRNAFFRYAPLTRLDKLTTTRSNAYAVWITIGFFEVREFAATPSSGSVDYNILSRYGTNAGTLVDAEQDPLFRRIYPESLLIGKEVGLDTGEVRRMRGFSIIDRTLPAAFEPGVDHNVENVIRLKRRIE